MDYERAWRALIEDIRGCYRLVDGEKKELLGQYIEFINELENELDDEKTG